MSDLQAYFVLTPELEGKTILMKKLLFFTEEEFKTVDAFAGRIIPAGDNPEEDPGAREVGSAEYVDIAVARRDHWAQEFVRNSIKKLADKSQKKFGKANFKLAPEQQDQLIEEFSQDKDTEAAWVHLRKMVLYGYHSNYVKEGYDGKRPWEVTGYLGPVTWLQATTEMINRHYSDVQEDTTFTFGGQ